MSRLRTVLGAVGILLGAIGALLESQPLVWIAIGMVGAAIVLRMVARAPTGQGTGGPP